MTNTINNIIDQALIEQHLPASYRDIVDQYLLPLSNQLACLVAARQQQQAFVLGVNGAQGTGKSTICHFLKFIFEHVYDFRCVILSIDDFYLSRNEREQLAKDRHPLLKTRGVPGTHDTALALTTMKSLLEGATVPLPAFDKATDDVVPRQHWLQQDHPVDVILFEGWCVGAKPQDAAALVPAVNELERVEDQSGEWRAYVNDCLGKEYQELFACIDYLLMLKAPNMASVLKWRSLQEQKLATKHSGTGLGEEKTTTEVMSGKQLKRFVQHYERLTRHMLEEMPSRADTIFSFCANHRITQASGCFVTGKKASQLIIFTDLDGTLLDHDNYSFDQASVALEQIKQLGIPLILNSSKTFAEMQVIQQQLGICQPVICENGAAVYIPSMTSVDAANEEINWHSEIFAEPREKIIKILNYLREQFNYEFIGFNDCDTQGIADLTGLDYASAERAAQRSFSEPLLWQGAEQQRCYFLQQLRLLQLEAQQGGRFISISGGGTNKATAMEWLCNYYAQGQTIITVALGDSPNDTAMLEAADIAVIIKSEKSDAIELSRPRKIIRTRLRGPAGWQGAMDEILPTLKIQLGMH